MLENTPSRMLARYGRTMVLRRRLSTTTFASASAKAVRHGFSPEQLVGDVRQGDAQILIDAAPLEAAGIAPVVKGDQIIDFGRTWQILGAEARAVRDNVTHYECWARGG